MKRKIDFLIVALFAVVLFASCERVAPNYAGVLMENYGKQGKEDFKIVAGKVSTWELGTELFQVPSRKHKTDSLMADGGSLVFEKRLEQIVDKEFEKRGLQLLTFSAQLEFSRAVRDKIDSRNEVNTNISVLDQKIEEQKKQNELEQLKTEQALIASRGLTREILYKQFIDKWDGKTPLYGIAPEFLKMTK